jgi:hypothetical protein
MIGVLPVVFLAHNPSWAQQKSGSPKLDVTRANLLMLSLQLAEQANQLYTIKDNLVTIVQARTDNLTLHDKYVIDVVSELKHIATIAYFESKLLGVILLVREEYKHPFMNARIPELTESIKSTKSSLQPIQIAYSGIQNNEALDQIDKAKEILHSLNQLYANGIEILQKAKTEKGAEAKGTPP